MFSYSQRDENAGDAVDVRDPSPLPLYWQRKESGLCVRCGEPAAPDSLLCAPHWEDAKERAARSAKVTREARRAKKRCAYCNRKSETRRCRACSIAHGKRPAAASPTQQGVNTQRTGVDKSRRRPPAHFHTEGINGKSSWSWRTEADGRRRKRGNGRGHRGAPSRAETDAFDARVGETEWNLALADLALYHSEANQALPPIQRAAALRSAIGHLELAGRIGEDLVERLRKRLR